MLVIFFDQVVDFLPVVGVPKIIFLDGQLGESYENPFNLGIRSHDCMIQAFKFGSTEVIGRSASALAIGGCRVEIVG